MKSSIVQKKDRKFELFRLTPLSKQILELIGAGKTATEVVKLLGCSKSNISYHVSRFEKHDLICLKLRDVSKYYRITSFGSKILTRSEGLVKVPVVLEDYPLKFSIIEAEKSSLDWVKLGNPRNWVKMGVKIGKIRVEKNGDKSIIIHSGQIRGFDASNLLVEAGGIIQNVKSVLEKKFGIVLSDIGVSLHKPVVRFYTEEAKELNKFGTVVIEGFASLDHSPPENVPHVEYHGLENIFNYLVMPDRVARIEQKVDSIEDRLDRLVAGLEKLIDPLNKMVNLTEFTVTESREKDVKKFKYYVS